MGPLIVNKFVYFFITLKVEYLAVCYYRQRLTDLKALAKALVPCSWDCIIAFSKKNLGTFALWQGVCVSLLIKGLRSIIMLDKGISIRLSFLQTFWCAKTTKYACDSTYYFKLIITPSLYFKRQFKHQKLSQYIYY